MMSMILMMIFLGPSISFLSWIMLQFVYMYMYMNVLMSLSFDFFSQISYSLGFDYFSWGLILMSFVIGSLMLISMLNFGYISMFIFMNLLLSFFLYIIFSSLNFLHMYISFEFVLVPLVILILGWGYQPERLVAGLYLFFYTVLVSLPLFIFLIYLYVNNGSLFFDMLIFDSHFFLFHLILLIVFMVKMPMYFMHFWLPKAHVQAPVSGSMILAGLMLKIGGYGLIRCMFIYEYLYMHYSFIWFSISIVGSVLISMLCLIQGDMKCMIAYSSISHMGLVIMGLISMSMWGLVGSYLLMLGHGFCSSAMFYMSNVFYMRTSSRSFFINKGLMNFIPSCSLIWFILCSFNMSCPPSLNFISELMILSSMVSFWFNSSFFFVGVSFFCACFSYYLYSYSQHGLYHNLYSFSSINLLEFLCLLVHIIPLIFIPLFMKMLM